MWQTGVPLPGEMLARTNPNIIDCLRRLEGVEDHSTLRQLEVYGCDVAQGYCISRPLPADLLPEWIEAYRKERP